MNIRHIRDLALKILGIYYLSSALVRAPQFASLFLSWDKSPETAGHKLAIALSVLVPLAFWLLIGLLLTFRTPLVAAVLWVSQEEDSRAATPSRPSLRFWIVLIGFFFFVSAAGGAVAQVWTLSVNRNMRGSFMYYKFLPELVTLVLSVLCILKAQAIDSWLKTKIGEDSQPSPGACSGKAADGLPENAQD